MMKAAQQGGGGQHGNLLAGGTALPGGPSPQPGQPGGLMQGGAYIFRLSRPLIFSYYDVVPSLRKESQKINIIPSRISVFFTRTVEHIIESVHCEAALRNTI